MRNRFLKATLLVVVSAGLFACGGGGSSTSTSSPTTPTTPTTPSVPAMVNPITVVPAMGGFSAGANVTFLDPTGKSLGTAQTNATGVAVVDIGKYSGPFISQVTGGPNVTVYNERTLGFEPFGATNSLLAVMPSVPTGANPRFGVTPLTSAAAAVLIPNPLSPVIPGSTATIQAAMSIANATVAVAAGLPPGVSLLTAPEPLTSPTSKITTTDPAAAAYGAFLASMAISGTGSLVSNASALAKDAAANNGALPASTNLLISSAASLAAVVSSNVAPSSLASLGATLTNLTKAVAPDPKLANASSLTSINNLAVAANGGIAIPPTIAIPQPTNPTTGTSTSTSTVIPVKPPTVPTPVIPLLPSGSVTSGASGSSVAAAAAAITASSSPVYGAQSNSLGVPGSSGASLLALYTTSGSLPTEIANTTNWSDNLNRVGSVNARTWFTYTRVTNSGAADGTYLSTLVPANTTVYIYTPGTVTTVNPLGAVLPACPSAYTTTTSADTIANPVSSNGTIIVNTTNQITGAIGVPATQTLTFTGNVINGVVYGFFPQTTANPTATNPNGSGSGLFSGVVTGSLGGSSGLYLNNIASGSTSTNSIGSFGFASGSGSGIVVASSNVSVSSANSLNGTINYNLTRTATGQIVFQCQ